MAKKRTTRFPSTEELQRLTKEYEDRKYADFNRLKEPFAKYALSMFVADRLLVNRHELTPEQEREVVREGNIARSSAYRVFQEILTVGIPDHYISCHLQPDFDDEEDE